MAPSFQWGRVLRDDNNKRNILLVCAHKLIRKRNIVRYSTIGMFSLSLSLVLYHPFTTLEVVLFIEILFRTMET